LIDCRITNAVRCVPPENKPTPEEIKTCRGFLVPTVGEMKKLQAIVALGRIAHESIVRALGGNLSDVAFGHGSRHQLGPIALFCSYHCSRYNTNTRVLTPEMFRKVFGTVRRYLDA
jgi:uracil-DNA glycosylase family 4